MQEKILQGKISTTLIGYAVPVILSMAATQFYSIADAMMVGTGLGSGALAAVSNGATVLQFFLFISGGMELGGNLLVASIKKSRTGEKLTKTVYNMIVLDLAIGVVLMILGQVFLGNILNLINTPEMIFSQAMLYTRIYLAGLPFQMGYDLMKQILMGYGDSRRPMCLVLLTTCFNIGMDAVLIYVIPLGVAGAAIASAAAQVIGMILCFGILYWTILKQRFRWEYLGLGPMREMMRLSLPTIFQQIMGPFSSMVRQSLLGRIGVSAIAGFSAANSLSVFLLMPMAGCSQALVVFTAQNLSAGQEKRTREAARVSRWLTAGITTALILLCVCFHEPLLSLYTSDREALSYGALMLTHEPFFYYFYALRNINESRLRGYRKMKEYLISSISTTCLVVLFTWLLVGQIGFSGFYLATGAGNILGLAVSGVLASSLKKEKISGERSGG